SRSGVLPVWTNAHIFEVYFRHLFKCAILEHCLKRLKWGTFVSGFVVQIILKKNASFSSGINRLPETKSATIGLEAVGKIIHGVFFFVEPVQVFVFMRLVVTIIRKGDTDDIIGLSFDSGFFDVFFAYRIIIQTERQ